MYAWMPALMRSFGSCHPHIRLGCKAGYPYKDLIGRGTWKLRPAGRISGNFPHRYLSQGAVQQTGSGVENLEDPLSEDDESSNPMQDSKPLASPGVEEVRQSWQDVAADRQKGSRDLKPAKKRKEVPSVLYEDDKHSIRDVHIPRSAWVVLLNLRAAGHEGYIVGGAVRDLLLKGQPKDFDILTTATVFQVDKLMYRSRLIGKRFPIVQVVEGGDMLEVSSFSTDVALTDLPFDAAALMRQRKMQLGKLTSNQQGLLWSDARKQNALARDFTVNALMYDPFSRVIFDYTGGVLDCRKATLRTIIDPETSFTQDPARMVRALRLAARAGLKMDDATGKAIRSGLKLLLDLPQGRMSMEVNSLLAYGAASDTMRLMWQYGMLELIFPLLAEYLKKKKYPRSPRKAKSDTLFEVLTRMDQSASPEHPLHAKVWSSVLVGFVAAQVYLEADIAVKPSPTKSGEKKVAPKPPPIIGRPGSLPPAEPVNFSDEELIWQADMEGLDVGLPQATAAPAEDSDDDCTETDAESDPYMKIVGRTLDAFIDDTETNCVSKAQRYHVFKMLRSEQKYRENIDQHVKLKCAACKSTARVQLDAKSPKCGKCGHNLPTKPLKVARTPELMTVSSALKLCHQEQRKASRKKESS